MNRKLSRPTIAVLLAVTLLGSLVIGGVIGQQAQVEQTEESATQETTYLRVVHASPDAPAVDIYLNETPMEVTADNETTSTNVTDENETTSTNVTDENETTSTDETAANESTLTNVTFTNVSFSNVSEYMAIEAGTYNVTITAAGDREAVVFEDTVTFDARTVTTLAAAGEIGENASVGETEENTTVNETEENTTVGETDENTTVNETEENTTVGETDENTTVNETEENTTVGETDENTTVGETDENTTVGETDENTTVGETDENTTEGAMDENATEPFAPVMYDDDALRPAANDSAIRIVHLSPDAPTVDVTTANGTVLADGLSFLESSEYLTVPAGDHEVQIRADTPDQNGTVLTTVNVSVENETAHSAMAVGYVNATDEQTPFEVTLTEDATRTVHLPSEATNETDV